jgi:hypothetical protein
MTVAVTLYRRSGTQHPPAILATGKQKNVRYVIDDRQLLGLWSVIEYFGVLREITDEDDRREILTQAQMLLTGFIVGLQSLPGEQGNRATIGIQSREATGFDA